MASTTNTSNMFRITRAIFKGGKTGSVLFDSASLSFSLFCCSSAEIIKLPHKNYLRNDSFYQFKRFLQNTVFKINIQSNFVSKR